MSSSRLSFWAVRTHFRFLRSGSLIFPAAVSGLQAFIYFSQQTDTRAIRTLVSFFRYAFFWGTTCSLPGAQVGCVVFFDFVHQALISHTGAAVLYRYTTFISSLIVSITVYHYLITNYGIPSALGTVVWYVSLFVCSLLSFC